MRVRISFWTDKLTTEVIHINNVGVHELHPLPQHGKWRQVSFRPLTRFDFTIKSHGAIVAPWVPILMNRGN
jgi:hypothetical protein